MSNQLEKKITLFGLCSIAIGSSIGSGIFVTPASTLAVLPNVYWALVPWVLGGIASFCGALTFAELGSRFPKSGGIYIYLKEAYGPLFGFLYGWVTLTVINTGALAGLAMVFVDYLSFFVNITAFQKQLIGVCSILLLTFINVRGVSFSQILASTFTSLKLLAICFIIATGIYFLGVDGAQFADNVVQPTPPNIANSILMAFIGVFWSFGGWHHISYLSDEVKDVQKTLPRALFISTIAITLLYLLIILAYMTMLPLNVIGESKRLAGDALAAVIPFGGKLVALFIAVSVFGSIAIYTMSAPRIYFAMAQDGIFFKSLASIHPKYKTPHVAIYLQSVWAIILVLSYGSFSKIITYVTFMDIVFMSLAAASIFVFRSRKLQPGSYVVSGYPIVPLIYLMIVVSFVLYTFLDLNKDAWLGLGMTAIGVVLYYILKIRNKEL
jgi:basic amino acid/polyamine antiporter, APA family